jgi:hypothetical protein
MSRVSGLVTTTSRPFEIAQAINQIRRVYGACVDIDSKSKTLLKFGRNTGVGATRETVSMLAAETFVDTNIIDTMSSSSVADDQDVVIEGHTISGTGADSQFTFVIQTATLNGQSKVTLDTPLARVSRAYNASATNIAGDVHVYEDTALTTGVPTDLTKAHIKISGSTGDQQTFKAATTISDNDFLITTQVYASVAVKTVAGADIILEIREPGGVFRPKYEFTVSFNGGAIMHTLKPCIIVPQNADVRVTALASTTNVQVDAGFNGYLGTVT